MPKQPMSIAEKQQRQLLRKMARSTGKALARQSAVIEETASREIKDLARALQDSERGAGNYFNRHSNASYEAYSLAESIRTVTSVVRASFGVDQHIEYDYSNLTNEDNSRLLSARTNLKSIYLDINLTMINDFSDTGIKRTIALLKGATYHEVAHCLWTRSWESVAKDYAHLFPADLPWVKCFNAWNLLEDGRIETLLVHKSPIIRNYLLPLVYQVVINIPDSPEFRNAVADAMPFLIVRSYLPSGLRRSALLKCAQYDKDLSILSTMSDISKQFQTAQTWEDQIPFVIQFHRLLEQWNSSIDSMGHWGDPVGDHNASNFGEPNGPTKFVPVIGELPDGWKSEDFQQAEQDKPEQDKDAQKDEGIKGASGDNAEDSDGETSDGAGQDSIKPSSNRTDAPTSQPSNGSGSSAGSEQVSTAPNTPDLHEEFDKSVNDAVSSNELNEVLNNFNKALSRTIQKGGAGYGGYRNENSADQQLANNITTGMINSLDTLIMTPDPSMAYRQQDGSYLDVEAFVTRDIGDDRFWVDRDGVGERGHDLAVSLLLDCSGSMYNSLDKLGVVAYAVRRACDHFDIPCSTTLFGSGSLALWDNDDEPELLVLPNLGGTNIGEALLDIPNHRAGKRKHLIVVLTDGEWSDVTSVRPFMRDDEVCLLVGFGIPWSNGTRGADCAVSITDLISFPSEVEKQIARFF